MENAKKEKNQKKLKTLSPARPRRGRVDTIFLLLVLLLLIVGLVSLFSASYANAFRLHGNSYKFILPQIGYALIGLMAMGAASQFPYKKLDHPLIVWGLYGVTLILLVAVFQFDKINNAHRWIIIGGSRKITFQPSEVAKFAIVLLYAHLINLNYDRMDTARYGLAPPLLALMPVVYLVYKEPHISGTLLILAIAMVMLFVGGVKLHWFLAMGAAGVLGLVGVALSGKISYFLPRIEMWRHPELYSQGLGWQTLQSLYAIGSGGVMGEGIGGSAQKYGNLPELQNDYIFAIVCEEVGFVGAAIIIILFALLIWRGFVISTRCRDRFGAMLGVGLTAQVGIQTIMNILVVTNTIPSTGISLPFFSAGGTSLIMLLAQMGIVLSISRCVEPPDTYSEKEYLIKEEKA